MARILSVVDSSGNGLQDSKKPPLLKRDWEKAIEMPPKLMDRYPKGEAPYYAIWLKEGELLKSTAPSDRTVEIGEETGALDQMLYKVADVYDEEVSVLVDGLVSMLEPIMVVVLGLIVGFIVIALFMPLVKLLNDLS